MNEWAMSLGIYKNMYSFLSLKWFSFWLYVTIWVEQFPVPYIFIAKFSPVLGSTQSSFRSDWIIIISLFTASFACEAQSVASQSL